MARKKTQSAPLAAAALASAPAATEMVPVTDPAEVVQPAPVDATADRVAPAAAKVASAADPAAAAQPAPVPADALEAAALALSAEVVPATDPPAAAVFEERAYAVRALRFIEHNGVLYGPGAPSGAVFTVNAAAREQLLLIGAIEL